MMSQTSLLPETTAGAASAPAARAFFSRISAGVRSALSECKPWSEMVDRSVLSKPESLSEATSRIRSNLAYFRVNYVMLMVGLVCVSLVAHPVSMVVILGLVGAWVYAYVVRSEPLVVMGRSFGDREVLGILAVLTVVVVFLTEVGSLLAWSLLVGAAIVALHGALRAPEELFLDEQQPPMAQGGLLSFMGATASTQPPRVVGRV